MKLAKEFRWEMGHRLVDHEGSCRNVHGHSYKLIVEVRGEPMADGMIIDLQDIGAAVKPVLAELDHAFLCHDADTEVIAFLEQHDMKRVVVPYPSTVENICKLFTEKLLPFVGRYDNVDRLAVRVYETPNSMAELETVLDDVTDKLVAKTSELENLIHDFSVDSFQKGDQLSKDQKLFRIRLFREVQHEVDSGFANSHRAAFEKRMRAGEMDDYKHPTDITRQCVAIIRLDRGLVSKRQTKRLLKLPFSTLGLLLGQYPGLKGAPPMKLRKLQKESRKEGNFMDTLRIGIIGMGNMGQNHARNLLEGKVKGAELTAVCDAVRHDDHPFVDRVKSFQEDGELFASGLCDGVIIATPHYFHTTQGIAALEAGMHLLVEKPLSVHKQDCEKLLAAHTDKSKVFSAMFNQRTDPHYTKVRELVMNGELGTLRRVNWIITNWYRTEIYYSGGGWRATWKGEGGGVLLNQCPHNLDLLQWICGMPDRVRAFAHLGKYHDIEVEDDVTAYLEWDKGCTGVFITTTGEAPGTNRLELTGDRGKIVLEHDKISFTRNEVPMDEFSRSSKSGFAAPGTWNVDIPVDGHGSQHMGVVQNWIDTIHRGGEGTLISPAEEGIHSVELANAMLYSSLTGETVALPLDAAAYAAKLQELIDTSTHVKKVVDAGVEDVSGTFGH